MYSQVIVWAYAAFSSIEKPRMEFLGHMVNLCENGQNCFPRGCVIYIPTTSNVQGTHSLNLKFRIIAMLVGV